jgi:hypothetical protein
VRFVKRLAVLSAVCCAFILGYAMTATAWPGVADRAEYHGYFRNIYDDQGTFVWPKLYDGGVNAIPNSVGNANSFISLVRGKLGGDTRNRTGAAFIVQSMLGSTGAARSQTPSAAQLTEWEARVRAAAARPGGVNWDVNFSYTVNSYYQGTSTGPNPADDAFTNESGTRRAIVFYHNGGTYAIKRDCANPLGNLTALPDDLNFAMSGRTTVDNPNPRPGDTIVFSHFLRNGGPSATGSTNIWFDIRDFPSDAVLEPGHNSGTYTVNQEKPVWSRSRRVPVNALPGSQICELIFFVPATQNGNSNRGSPACATVQYDFTLVPTIRIEINDAAPGAQPVAQPGDKIEFFYNVNNTGTTASTNVGCTIYGLTRNGFYNIPSPHDSASDPGYAQPAHGCPRTFPVGNTDLVAPPETITSVSAADINRSICRAFWVNPATVGGGPASTEVCVRIAGRPYLRVYGGDISAGGGQTTAPGVCTNNLAAAIIGWNRGSGAPGYGGAGVQFGATALSRIFDVATSLNNGAGAAPVPSGLAFANSGAAGSNFGGSFGSAPCIPDRFNTANTTALAGNNIDTATLTGINRYRTTSAGPFTISGNVNPNQRTILYVDGDVLLSGNVTYTGSWNTNSMPLFQLVVRGNIYVSQNVTRLDGVYVAQPNGGPGGVIYTCANAAVPVGVPSTAAGAFYNPCRNKLTINGAFAAKQVRFMRTTGTVQQANAGDVSTDPDVAEVFNFSPALWIAQPPSGSGSSDAYDAITSLPPVL